MVQQGEGWPLGLQPLNVRVGVTANRDYSGSVSFNTLVTASPVSFTDSSSDFDTESTGSFFHDKSITLGRLIGVSNILELSRRSFRGRTENAKDKRSNTRSRTWLSSLCSRKSTDAYSVVDTGPSLGHFLAEERRAADENRRNQSVVMYGVDDLELAQSEANSLFINGCVAPPQSSLASDAESERNGGIQPANANDNRVALLCACVCGH